MRRVFKYKLETVEHQVVKLPSNSTILSVVNQQDYIMMYVEVDDTETEERDIDIYIHGTGHEMNPKATVFLGTVMLMCGRLVCHVFANGGQLFYCDYVSIKKVIPRLLAQGKR